MSKFKGKWVDYNSFRYTSAITWSGSGPYTMTIPASTHKHGTDPIVEVRFSDSGTSSNCTWDVDINDATGDVTIISKENFSGKVIIA